MSLDMTINRLEKVSKKQFGRLKDGRETELYTLTNEQGIKVNVSNYGARLVSFICPDRRGHPADIILGFDNLEGYINDNSYHGATVGRFANRISQGGFHIGANHYPLAQNDGPNHLHGGIDGFDKRLWVAHILNEECAAVRFSLFSPDGDQGYPGNVTVHLVYRLNNDNQLSINIDASSDIETPLSLTHHSYFNLTGRDTILDHWLTLYCDSFTPLDAHQIPTGDIVSVSDTPFDFRQAHTIGDRIDEPHPQLMAAKGYDHNFVTRVADDEQAVPVARLEDKKSGRILSVSSNAPGVQIYSGNYLDGNSMGKGILHEKRHALCIEPQHFPDAPNQVSFPSAIIGPNKRYRHTMIYAVSTN